MHIVCVQRRCCNGFIDVELCGCAVYTTTYYVACMLRSFLLAVKGNLRAIAWCMRARNEKLVFVYMLVDAGTMLWNTHTTRHQNAFVSVCMNPRQGLT